MAKDWHATGSKIDTEISPTGAGFQRVWQTHYEVTDGPAKGVTGYVRVPADQYNAENVGKAISTAVAHHQSVMSL
jgi:hypothetical protein